MTWTRSGPADKCCVFIHSNPRAISTLALAFRTEFELAALTPPTLSHVRLPSNRVLASTFSLPSGASVVAYYLAAANFHLQQLPIDICPNVKHVRLVGRGVTLKGKKEKVRLTHRSWPVAELLAPHASILACFTTHQRH